MADFVVIVDYRVGEWMFRTQHWSEVVSHWNQHFVLFCAYKQVDIALIFFLSFFFYFCPWKSICWSFETSLDFNFLLICLPVAIKPTCTCNHLCHIMLLSISWYQNKGFLLCSRETHNEHDINDISDCIVIYLFVYLLLQKQWNEEA